MKQIYLEDAMGTGAIAGFWVNMLGHPGIEKPKKKKMSKKDKKGMFSPFSRSVDAEASHVKGTMKPNGLMEKFSKISDRVLLEELKDKSIQFNKIINSFDKYFIDHDTNSLKSDLIKLTESQDSDQLKLFSKHIHDIFNGYGIQSVNNNGIDHNDLSFLYEYAKQRIA